MNRHPLVGWLLLAPSLLLLGGLVLFPILYNFWLSLHDKHAFMPVQAFVGLRHYVYFAQDPEFWEHRRAASYATLMSIDHVLALKPIEWEKRDRRGWVVVRSVGQPSLFRGDDEL